MKHSIIALLVACFIGCGGVGPVSGPSCEAECCLSDGEWVGRGVRPSYEKDAESVAEAVEFDGQCGVFVDVDQEYIVDGDCVRRTISRYSYQPDEVSVLVKQSVFCDGVGYTVKAVLRDYGYRVEQ